MEGIMIVVGNIGSGKSTVANLLRDPASPLFKVDDDADAVTLHPSYAPSYKKNWFVIDTPGMENWNIPLEYFNKLSLNQKIYFVTCLSNAGRVSLDDVYALKKALKFFKQDVYILILNCASQDTNKICKVLETALTALLIPLPTKTIILPHGNLTSFLLQD